MWKIPEVEIPLLGAPNVPLISNYFGLCSGGLGGDTRTVNSTDALSKCFERAHERALSG